ncbi:MATE family efflux transporter [Helicobacter sp. T3_23-1056]
MIQMTYRQKLRKITRIALPSAANSLLDIIVMALGMVFMGHFGQEHIVAVSIAMQFMMMFFAIQNIFYIGTNAQISRFFGARDSQSASMVFSTLFLLCAICGIPLVCVAFVSADWFVAWFDLSEKSHTLTKQFLSIAIFTLPAMLLKNIISAAFAAMGNTLSVFIIRIFSTIFCVASNYFLIFEVRVEIFGEVYQLGAGLGIIGAALASTLTGYLELFLSFLLAYKKGRFFIGKFGIFWKYFYIALKIGIPTGIERFLTLGSLVLTTRFIASFGDIAVAGSQIGSRVESFAFMPGFGFMVAAMALTGQNLGANRVWLAEDLNKTILQISSVVMGILGVLMAAFAIPLSKIFYDDSAVIEVAKWYLWAVGLSQIPLIWVFVLDGVLRGAGITKRSLMINAISIWLFRIAPMWIGIECGLGIWWVFVLIFVETYIRAGIFYVVYARGSWKRAGRELF